jgi:hypothetical protein
MLRTQLLSGAHTVEGPKERLVSAGRVGELVPGSGGAAGSCETSGSFIASSIAGRD